MDRKTATCRHFNGYKPCVKHSHCNASCPHFEIPKVSILIVHLGAMGAVVRSTALLAAIKRKYSSSFITWITEESTKPLLICNPMIDKVLSLSSRDLLILSGLKFDIGFFIDKSAELAGLIKLTQPLQQFGFTTQAENGAVIPLTDSAQELWDIGLDNHKKFFQNKKTEIQLIAEALELPYERDEYLVPLTTEEKALSQSRRKLWSQENKKILIGLNTGASGVIPNKTITNEMWIKIIAQLTTKLNTISTDFQLVLLGGGKEDHSRNEIIVQQSALSFFPVILSPALKGLRDGLCSVNAMDIVITSDSLGMHMAIACRKYVVAWFGPTCSQEIDLFDRGVKVVSSMKCSPCWNRNCLVAEPCNQSLDIEMIVKSVIASPLLQSKFYHEKLGLRSIINIRSYLRFVL